jgi:hypothetical protein
VRGLAVAAVAGTLAVTGCGGSATHPGTVPARAWQSNVRGVLQQLLTDATTASAAGTTRAGAGRALRSLSDLYGLLVVYSDLGGCRRMVVAAAAPPAVTRAAVRPCAQLERAAALFGRAASRNDAAALVRATREVRRAEPAIVRALALRRIRG